MGKPGNPNWVRGGASPNPGGRPKRLEAFRELCVEAVDKHCISAWIAEVESHGKEWIRASELLAAYGYGKPAQPVTGEGGDGPVQARLVHIFLPDNGRG